MIDTTDDPAPRRRSRRNALILGAAGFFAVVALGLLVAGPDRNPPALIGSPGREPVASLPPASPGVVSAGYVGNRWRLTAVTDRRGATEVPESVDARLELAADGTLVAFDGVNTTSGRFVVTRTGFDVVHEGTTLAGYGGNDPAVLAAVAGIGATTSATGGQPVRVTVVSADRERLVVQGGGVRLSFVRSGAAADRT